MPKRKAMSTNFWVFGWKSINLIGNQTRAYSFSGKYLIHSRLWSVTIANSPYRRYCIKLCFQVQYCRAVVIQIILH